jgi:transposase-like protein
LADFDLETWLWQDLTTRAREQLQALVEASVSASTVSRVSRQLTERARAWHRESLPMSIST